MKRILLVFTMGALIACPVILKAQDNTAPPSGGGQGGPPPGGGPGGHHHDMLAGLTDAEKAEVIKDRDAVLAANPTLAAEVKANMDAMKAAHDSGQKPTEEQFQAMKATQEKVDAAMIKLDPAIAPILEKLKAHHHHDGPPPAPASGV